MIYANIGCRCDYCLEQRQAAERRVQSNGRRAALAEAIQRENRERERIEWRLSCRLEPVTSNELERLRERVAELRREYGRHLERENAELLRLLRKTWCRPVGR